MSFITRNIRLGKALRISSWRRIAIGTWPLVGDPSIYGMLEIDARPALAYIAKLREQSGARITVTHFVGRALAEVYRQHPEINAVVRWGNLYPRPSVDVFFMVATDKKGEDLSGTVVREADKKSVLEISREMEGSVPRIREHGDRDFAGFKKLASFLPGILNGPAIKIAQWIMYPINLWSPLLGIPRDAFGSVMITNIGALGMDAAFAALVPYSRAPMVVTVGAVQDAPAVRDGQVIVMPQLRLGITIDHRVIDGMQASHMARTVKAIFAAPEDFFGKM